MKSIVIQSIIAALAAALVTLLFNYFANMQLNYDGFIKTDGKLKIKNQIYSVVEIGNYTDKYFEYVDISILSQEKEYEFEKQGPVIIKKISDDKKESIYRISQIPPHRAISILVSNAIEQKIFLISSSSHNIEDLSQVTPISKHKQSIVIAVYNGIIYAVMFFCFAFIIDYRNLKSHNEIKQRLNEDKEKINNLQKLAEKTQEATRKQKTLLLKRISDLLRELEFWRATIAGIAKNKSNYEELKNLVVNELKTFTTESKKIPGLEEIKFIENVYLKNEENP